MLQMHFYNAPESNSFNFSLFSDRNLITCFFRNAPIFYARFFWNAPFSSQKKWNCSIFGHFRKNAYAITWKIYPPHTFWGISSNPPYFNVVQTSNNLGIMSAACCMDSTIVVDHVVKMLVLNPCCEWLSFRVLERGLTRDFGFCFRICFWIYKWTEFDH